VQKPCTARDGLYSQLVAGSTNYRLVDFSCLIKICIMSVMSPAREPDNDPEDTDAKPRNEKAEAVIGESSNGRVLFAHVDCNVDDEKNRKKYLGFVVEGISSHLLRAFKFGALMCRAPEMRGNKQQYDGTEGSLPCTSSRILISNELIINITLWVMGAPSTETGETYPHREEKLGL
jgi:hypothetical protein